VFNSKALKVCNIFSKVVDYINKIVKKLILPHLVVGNQPVSHDKLQEKLKDNHLKSMLELSRLEELKNGMLEKNLIYPIKASTKL
jgi:hypothetical protein